MIKHPLCKYALQALCTGRSLQVMSFKYFVCLGIIVSALIGGHASADFAESDNDGKGKEIHGMFEVDELVVTGSRSATSDPDSLAVPVQVITEEAIRDIGAIKFSQVVEVVQGMELVNSPDLRIAPGLQTIRLRGMDVSHVLVLVDGKRLPGSRPGIKGYSYTDIGSISMDMIERIEVLRDGASAQYGADAVAGVVNLITKKYVQGFSANTQYGTSTRGDSTEKHLDATGGFAAGERSWVNLNAFATSKDHFDRTPSVKWDSPDYTRKGVNAGYVFDYADNQHLNIKGRYSDTESRYLRAVSDDGEESRDSFKKDYNASVNWAGIFGKWEFEVNADTTMSDTDYEHTEDPDYEGGMEWGVNQYEARASYMLTDSFRVFSGLAMNDENIDSRQRNLDEDRDVKAAYLEMDMHFFDRLNVQLAGRYENYSDFGSNFAPKMSLKLDVVPGLWIRGSVSKSYQAPTLFQLHDEFLDAMGWNDIYGNPELEASDGKNVTCGLVWHYEPLNMKITVDGFYNRVEDRIETVYLKQQTATPEATEEMIRRGIPATTNTVSSYENVTGTTKFRGVEAGISTDLFWNLGLEVNGNYLNAEDPDGEDLPNRPRSGVTAILKYDDNNRLWGNLRYKYRGKYISDGYYERIPYFDYFSAQINYRVWQHITLFAGGRNIFDEKPPIDLSKYEDGHMEAMLDSSEGAFFYAGLRLNY